MSAAQQTIELPDSVARHSLRAATGSALPIPGALYPCEICREDYSWPADDLYWSARVKAWICGECWDDHDDAHGERGIRLDDEIKRQKNMLRDSKPIPHAFKAHKKYPWFCGQRRQDTWPYPSERPHCRLGFSFP